MWPASTATSVPAPMAIPMSAVASAGASFTPSPTIATFFPCACSSRTLDALSSGSTSAKTVSIPRSSATASATAWASPVSIATSMPRSCSALMARGSPPGWRRPRRTPPGRPSPQQVDRGLTRGGRVARPLPAGHRAPARPPLSAGPDRPCGTRRHPPSRRRPARSAPGSPPPPAPRACAPPPSSRCRGDRMLGLRLDRRPRCRSASSSATPLRHRHLHHPELAKVSVPVLSKITVSRFGPPRGRAGRARAGRSARPASWRSPRPAARPIRGRGGRR
jgi:hypothetical protein